MRRKGKWSYVRGKVLEMENKRRVERVSKERQESVERRGKAREREKQRKGRRGKRAEVTGRNSDVKEGKQIGVFFHPNHYNKV